MRRFYVRIVKYEFVLVPFLIFAFVVSLISHIFFTSFIIQLNNHMKCKVYSLLRGKTLRNN